MKCFYCEKEACAKIASAKADIIGSLFGKKAWVKDEKYVCRKHFFYPDEHIEDCTCFECWKEKAKI